MFLDAFTFHCATYVFCQLGVPLSLYSLLSQEPWVILTLNGIRNGERVREEDVEVRVVK
jgi:hypothetical protein